MLRRTGIFGGMALASLLGGCSMMGSDGPSSRTVNAVAASAAEDTYGLKLIDVDDAVARRIKSLDRTSLFSETFGDGHPVATIVGSGDVLDVAIWEAPPAALFGAAAMAPMVGLPGGMTQSALPEQVVDPEGNIRIPFLGAVRAAGRSPQQVAADIAQRLQGKAHQPQVIVRIARNQSATATVVSEGGGSARVPLTPKGERILDVLSATAAAPQSVSKTTVQLTRGNLVRTMSLEQVIKDPRQNIILQPNDVLTALFQPYAFTVLGAAGRNAEVNFEAQGITLMQAIGRVGGLQNQRANPRGVFIFRFEDPAALGYPTDAPLRTTPDGKVPVIYRLDFKDPKTFFIAQNFPVRNKDVLYVSTAPFAELQKFVTIVAQTILPLVAVDNAVSNN
ncbi:capsular biosynthesis protein [Sphingomonas fennica]|uniref:Capsular biosynthesis protein n=2 Tax=Edaphosphingomonas fennica TaxID=114404 RepID=A0A2T4HLV9_9SPHN|nr:capsular biosynthesis protein [Sphingomonas fennica]